ncbi:hypothetical protein KKF91_14745 [Myxococcota bacterium]|nr:hypothetical protein [Myxococcota bacterium]MBU1431797.1 hypothetical protein [Myxococcota bacterium]MBU1896665.1 hypothetical protein [Myxococcota bacterium]
MALAFILSALLLASPVGLRLYEEAQRDLEEGALRPAEVKLKRALTLVEPEAALAAWIWLALASIAEQEGEDCEVVRRYQRYLVYAAVHPDEAQSMARASRRLRVAEGRCASLKRVEVPPPPPPPPPPEPPPTHDRLIGGLALGLGAALLGASAYELFQSRAAVDEIKARHARYERATEQIEARWRDVESAVEAQNHDAVLSGVLFGGALISLSFGLYQISKTTPQPTLRAAGDGLRWEVMF